MLCKAPVPQTQNLLGVRGALRDYPDCPPPGLTTRAGFLNQPAVFRPVRCVENDPAEAVTDRPALPGRT